MVTVTVIMMIMVMMLLYNGDDGVAFLVVVMMEILVRREASSQQEEEKEKEEAALPLQPSSTTTLGFNEHLHLEVSRNSNEASDQLKEGLSGSSTTFQFTKTEASNNDDFLPLPLKESVSIMVNSGNSNAEQQNYSSYLETYNPEDLREKHKTQNETEIHRATVDSSYTVTHDTYADSRKRVFVVASQRRNSEQSSAVRLAKNINSDNSESAFGTQTYQTRSEVLQFINNSTSTSYNNNNNDNSDFMPKTGPKDTPPDRPPYPPPREDPFEDEDESVYDLTAAGDMFFRWGK